MSVIYYVFSLIVDYISLIFRIAFLRISKTMQTFENHNVVFRNDVQRGRFEALSQRDFTVSIYPDDLAMQTLSIRDSVVYLLNQIGWTNFALEKKFSTYHNLTLEFLSSLYYDPTRGFGFGRGLATFRLFGNKYRFTHH